ncbi:Disintegrin and metalloproteinase domain-containing protein B [Neolecta irregularis DAH-3]|uniref:Disintegrin and metalloproteinase domain-containing protein B n=1 Tax=Neolecta irregularis (strain DAH-3) TaxID=1198029 RepID=A0A1U7LGI0_NEOID|nr:Disintegrin and metalloproteinase domain-containing protein B [Neolecta irregularis DAH-3]|eukprot:OLL21703.1 Disintegrin and metalloproteinase domain-containing protein B [Neolecta irregularis DAH-3]
MVKLFSSMWLPCFIIGCALMSVEARSSRPPPIRYVSHLKDIIALEKNDRSLHISFRLPFLETQSHTKLILEPNNDILQHPEASIEYHDLEGNVRKEPITRQGVQTYRGTCWVADHEHDWREAGWAAITLIQDGPLFEGAFMIDGMAHHVQPWRKYSARRGALDYNVRGTNENMVIWTDSHIESLPELLVNGHSCPADRLPYNIDPENSINKYFSYQQPNTLFDFWSSNKAFGYGSRLMKRQNIDGSSALLPGFTSSTTLVSTIGNTDGCPNVKKVALVGVAVDCEYAQTFSNSSETREHIITLFNTVSTVFESTFNVTLGLLQLVISDTNASCPSSPPSNQPWNANCNSNLSLDDRLNLISTWRGTRSGDGIAFWTLLTKCNSGTEVGVAWLGTLCFDETQTQGNTQVSGANVVTQGSSEWKVLAHETGHVFGAVHDCMSGCAAVNTTCCPFTRTQCDAGSQFLMNPTTVQRSNSFSPCSVGNVCSAIGSRAVTSSCLTTNKNIKLITAGQCGNGIVEEGEDCDCGGEEACAGNKCCNPKTCKFTTGSVCDDSNESCCKNCQYAPSSQICRGSRDEKCDPSEFCTGTSSACPEDQLVSDGTSCGAGSLACASGQCTSRDLQCTTQINGTTGDCGLLDCQVTCRAPEFGPATCVSLPQYFLDGTPCGISGTCGKGICRNQSEIRAVSTWIKQNKTIVIIVAAIVGGLLIFCGALSSLQRLRRKPTAQIRPRHIQSRRYQTRANMFQVPPGPQHPNQVLYAPYPQYPGRNAPPEYYR